MKKIIINLAKKVLIFTIIITAKLAIAFETIYFNVESLEEAITDVSSYLTKNTSNCEIEKLVLPQCTSEEFYKLSCAEEQFFLKKIMHDYHNYDFVIDFLLQNQGIRYLSNISIPLYEFNFNSNDDSKNRYLVYKFITGKSLGDLHKSMSEQPNNEILLQIYSKLGQVIGNIHKHGLVKISTKFNELTSKLVHSDLHSNNIMINQENSEPILIDIENGFFCSCESPELIKTDIDNFLIQALPIALLVTTNPNSEYNLKYLYNYIVAFITNYSTELSAGNSINFRQQINNHVLKSLTDAYLYVTNMQNLYKDVKNEFDLISQEEFNQRMVLLSELLMNNTDS